MSVTLRIARTGDEERVLRLVSACHDEVGLTPDLDDREIAIAALLSGEVPGALYLIGPPSSPVGYLSVSFGHSLSRGGTEAHLDELYIRPPVRRRGMGTEALEALMKMLGDHGVRSIKATTPGTGASLLRRLRFAPPDDTPMARTI